MNHSNLNQLIIVIRSCTNEKDLVNLLTGLLTPQEIEVMATRIEIVKQLKKKVPQREIAERLGVGIGTITHGSRELKRGNFKVIA